MRPVLAVIAVVSLSADVFAQSILDGIVLDASGQPIAGSTVIPLDSRDGRPLAEVNGVAIEAVEPLFDRAGPGIRFAISDSGGRFRFQLPHGKYRLVAWRWPNRPAALAFMEPERSLRIDGGSDIVDLTKDDMADVFIRPLGDGYLKVESMIGNDDAYLLLSSEPLRADPILGFAGLPGPFMLNLLAAQRMKKGALEIHGLPRSELHLAIFANDNNPGFGGASANLSQAARRQVKVPIIAAWSDGHKVPPESLAGLTARLIEDPVLRQRWEEAMKPRLDTIVRGGGHPIEWTIALSQYLDEEVVIDEKSKPLRLADIAAAIAYARLSESSANGSVR